jgi:hypothetical protein
MQIAAFFITLNLSSTVIVSMRRVIYLLCGLRARQKLSG